MAIKHCCISLKITTVIYVNCTDGDIKKLVVLCVSGFIFYFPFHWLLACRHEKVALLIRETAVFVALAIYEHMQKNPAAVWQLSSQISARKSLKLKKTHSLTNAAGHHLLL